MLGTDLSTFAEDLSVALGVPAEVDPRELVLPGMLVMPGQIEFDRLGTLTASATLEVWLVAGDTNPKTALDELTGMLLKLREYLGAGVSTVDPITVTLAAQSPDPLPALRCPIPIELSFTQ